MGKEGFEVRVSGNETDDMIRALRHDFEHVRSSLLRYGLELTMAAELLSRKAGMNDHNAADTANRCLAITRLAALLESTGLELPKFSLALEAEWKRDREESAVA